jgi:alpha-tubulin suppressor-like RCC1 family protein
MRTTICGLVWIALTAACGDSTKPDPPNVGSITITVLTTGQDPDGDGYEITVDGGSRIDVAPNGSITIKNVPAGVRDVRLAGLATNCNTGTSSQLVRVAAGSSVAVDYVISCVARVGNITVTITTTGSDLPVGTYRLGVDDDAGRPVGQNETTTLSGIREGVRKVWLRDLATNCAVLGLNPVSLFVGHGETARTAFAITCVTPTGPFVDVSAGANHTCARSAAGLLYCWGMNSAGQLGDGTTTTRLTPTLVRSDVSFDQISAGAAYTCARTASGATYCWGENSVGQLGDGTKVDRLVPRLVSGLTPFAEVSAGRDLDLESTGWGHTCARTGSGAVYCWGDNASGELGDGTGTARLVPTAVAGGLRFVDISAGGGHTCGVTDVGAAYCWGYNFSGQLGGGVGYGVTVPSPVNANATFTEIKASLYHSCGLTTTGAIYCWGFNGAGQLGNGTSTDPSTLSIFSPPAPVVGNRSFTAVTLGYNHSCGLASDGAAYCWGWNGVGALGDGTTEMRSVPTRVRGNLTFVEISAGWDHTCGRTANGVIYCWGANYWGALGDGTATPRLEPKRVLGR